MSGAIKKAALLLHGLSDADQRWILSRLPLDIRGRMTPLLIELNELGFDMTEFRDISADAVVQQLSVSDPDKWNEGLKNYRRAVDRVDSCLPRTIIHWASGETDWVISQILTHREWSWTIHFTNALPPYRRKRIEKLYKEVTRLPQKLGERLIQQLDLTLQQIEPLASHSDLGWKLNSGARNGGVGQWLRSFVLRT
ncbi:hypothetical protein [Polaromonas sp. A23]|uniref:hypothetical protein n=1 Tax=Polaromonas sp. A23 TaxID=1944133 RepID=UPI0009C58634|nr:hypothetical protein [Polaromonas sp. A23]OOG44441.1 hypothetical protein B0B52_06775 [Polaromonas sp. A23]